MPRKIVVARGEEGWTIGRDGQPFERFASKDDAVARARELITRLEGEVELVVDGDSKSSAAATDGAARSVDGASSGSRDGRRRR